jgi:predicted ferric reductase
MSQNLNSPWHDAVMQAFFILIVFALYFLILEGPPTFGMTADSAPIGDHTSVNDIFVYNPEQILFLFLLCIENYLVASNSKFQYRAWHIIHNLW